MSNVRSVDKLNKQCETTATVAVVLPKEAVVEAVAEGITIPGDNGNHPSQVEIDPVNPKLQLRQTQTVSLLLVQLEIPHLLRKVADRVVRVLLRRFLRGHRSQLWPTNRQMLPQYQLLLKPALNR